MLTPTGLQWNIGLTDEHVETRSSLRGISDLLVSLGLLSLARRSLVESWLLLRSQVDFELVLDPQEPVVIWFVFSLKMFALRLKLCGKE